MADIDHRFAERLLAWLEVADLTLARESASRRSFNDRPRAIEVIGMDKLIRAQEAWVAAISLWPNEDDAFEFLTRKHVILEGRRPMLVAIESAQGLKSVKENSRTT